MGRNSPRLWKKKKGRARIGRGGHTREEKETSVTWMDIKKKRELWEKKKSTRP